MPELPEVQTVVNTLIPRLLGRRIVRVVHLRPDIVTPADFPLARRLKGRTIESIHRRAKRIVFTLDSGDSFYIHLGMSGRLTIEESQVAIPQHTHLIVELESHATGGMQLRLQDPRRFGGIWWIGNESADGEIGPDALAIRPKQLAERLARTKRAIKNALLDQRVIAGLGNIYVDESLFDAGIHPLTPANELSPAQIARLNRSIKTVLRRALRHRGSTLRDYVDAEGGKGAFQTLHKVYDRAGQPCRACRREIERIVLGGRSTCFCPKCQPHQK